ncbi:unnamed protein product [Ambrosiozyma monospora]|uniref:Unnamed protein product n=1 Tax=Ambrosiozyma monospora TaxID=43982 RepID=A0A9W6ST58_AMBMO|nr:unnamed protein product [Ambrosiozyma monospora]
MATIRLLALLFQTLKNILLSLIPAKDREIVEDIMDLKLVIQQLNTHCFDFIAFSDWIAGVFKMHCAPMRDPWVDEMNNVFHRAYEVNEVTKEPMLNVSMIVEALRILFSILEAMKLDVANHQIRLLRPLLCSTAVTFEKEYFANAHKKNKVNFSSSSIWFQRNSMTMGCTNVKEVLNYAVLNLLSCSSMCNEFPNTLSFDHTRLILLRADIRQLICIKICTILYKNLVHQYKFNKEEYLSPEKFSPVV